MNETAGATAPMPARWLNRLHRRRRTLPLRLWLILAVVAITGAGFLSQMGLTAVISALDQQAEDARVASVRRLLGTDPARWQDPTWQRLTEQALDALATDTAIFAIPPATSDEVAMGQPVFATAGARAFLDTSVGSDTSAGAAPGQQVAKRAASQASSSHARAGSVERVQPIFERIIIPASAQPAGSPPVGVAFLWFSRPAPGTLSSVWWPVVELGTFALTLAIVVWLVGQPVLRPLAEMSRAADSVAGGDLDIHLTRSPVREIAEVSTALEGMSAALREALARQATLEDERRLFVSAIAHDLRTPLFMLRGYLQGLERGVAATPERRARYVSICRAKADELERLIADLFAYARLEYLEQAPERLPLDLGALLRQAAEAAELVAAGRQITVTVTGSPDPCPLLGDGHLLARAVENLIDNALRHTPAGGEIWVRWRRQESELVFAVEDSGPGIAATDLPHIFSALYRGEASRNRHSGGAGLGLAIARRVLRAHGGELVGGNRAEGGAIFTATLPLAHRAGAPAPATDIVASAKPA